MSRFVAISLILMAAFCAALAPVGWSFDARNGAGDWLTQRQALKAARFFYATTAYENDPRGRNNVAVIDYHLAIYDPDGTRQSRFLATRKASAIFRELAGEGYAPGAYNQGLMCPRCQVERPGHAAAKKWLRRAVALGDPLAPLAYALARHRSSTEEDPAEALRLVTELADAGDPIAAEELASYARGRDILTEEEVERYYLVAAQGGNVSAQEALGLWYEGDRREDWLKAAAKQGSVPAMTRLGERYFTGVFGADEDGAPDYKTAARWLARAVREGQKPRDRRRRIKVHKTGLRFRSLEPRPMDDINNSESAAYTLALIHMRGLLGEPDMERAEELLRYAALLPWKDSNLILIQIESERAPGHARKHHRRRLAEATLERYARDFEGRHASLKPFVERGDVRAVTEYDLIRWTRSDDPALDRAMLEALKQRDPRGLFAIERDLDLTAATDAWLWPKLVAARPVTVTMPAAKLAPRIVLLHRGARLQKAGAD
ncbi:tetratricopeptide repeat protein [Hyphococcus luteus]|uniref:Sel1 repeat family protein n=1 Tax=Hyphococcus luteus TaxID=2058213 RepID=A0A2S7JZY9_9PROT|nr:SEL1-like repeat protein [Marinicaulis flavus]PQA85817.1 hypothetical protein CW354_19930 [Marinicaulis flavus]